MWKWQLKQNNLVVARGSSDDKQTCLTEAFRYTEQYSEEDFKNMTLIIKELNND